MNSLPEEFVKTKIERTADKIKIGEYLKYNGELTGARIVQGYSLQIRQELIQMLEMLRRVKNVKDIGKLIFPKLRHWSI